MASEDKNKKLIERILSESIRQMCIRSKLGLADWDIDSTLRSALQEPSRLKEIQDIIRKYDDTYDLALKSNCKIKTKYTSIYKLNNAN